MQELTTAREVIEKLGGNTAVATLTARKPKAVTNWPLFNKFPADTFYVLREALERQGCTAPVSLWNMVLAEDERRAAS